MKLTHQRRPGSPLPTAVRLFSPPALSRIERTRRKPIVHRTDGDHGYLEGYDAARTYPGAGASIIQGVMDALPSPGAPRVFIVEALGDDGSLAFACATTTPADLLPSRTRRPRTRRMAGRVTA